MRDSSVVQVPSGDQVSVLLHSMCPLIGRQAGVRSHPIAGLAQLGERQTEVKLREFYLKVMCSIHINRTRLYFCLLARVIFRTFLVPTFGSGMGFEIPWYNSNGVVVFIICLGYLSPSFFLASYGRKRRLIQDTQGFARLKFTEDPSYEVWLRYLNVGVISEGFCTESACNLLRGRCRRKRLHLRLPLAR